MFGNEQLIKKGAPRNRFYFMLALVTYKHSYTSRTVIPIQIASQNYLDLELSKKLFYNWTRTTLKVSTVTVEVFIIKVKYLIFNTLQHYFLGQKIWISRVESILQCVSVVSLPVRA